MAITGFGYKEQWIGTGDTTDYTFDFKIYANSHLYFYLQDQFGNIVAQFTGDDINYLAGVTFDPVDGGGTISLAAVLQNQFVLTMFLANDFPDQPTSFPNKLSFTLEAIENALDFITAWGQRIAYLAQRSIRLHDLDDIDNFDMRLPQNLSANPGGIIEINDAGTGFKIGLSTDDLTQSIIAAQAACLASEIAAENSFSDASMRADDSDASAVAAQAALTATLAAIAAAPFSNLIVHSGPFAGIAPNANLNLPGEVTNSAVYSMVEYVARIRRGTATYARQEFTIFFRNTVWEIAIGPDLYNDSGADHNVTFTVDSVTGQINAAVANDGGSNAIIDLNKINWGT